MPEAPYVTANRKKGLAVPQMQRPTPEQAASQISLNDLATAASFFMPYATADMRSAQQQWQQQGFDTPDILQGVKNVFANTMTAKPSDLPLVGGLFGKIGDAYNAVGTGTADLLFNDLPKAVAAAADTPRTRAAALAERNKYKTSFGDVGRPKNETAPVNNAAADAVWNSIVQQESGGRPGVRGQPTPYGTALGMTQMLPATAKAMAAKLGVPYREELLTGTSPEAAQYQLKLGRAYFDEGLAKSGGDLRAAAMYYHGGPDTRIHGVKTNAYADQVLARAGLGGSAGINMPAFANPFDPSAAIAAGGMLDAGAQAAMKPESFTQALAPAPTTPEPKFAKPKDYTAQDAALAMLKPIELGEKQQQQIRRNNFFQGIAQAMANISPDAGLGQILLKLGAGALAGKAAAGNEIQARTDSFDEKMAKYRVAVYNNEAGKADELYQVAQNEAAALNQFGMLKYQAAMQEYNKNNFVSVQGDAVISSRTGADGKIITTRTPFKAPIMAGLMAAKASLLQNVGQQQFQGNSMVASAQNGLLAGVAAQEYSSALNQKASANSAMSEKALLELPGYVAGNVVGSGLAQTVIGEEKWADFEAEAAKRVQSMGLLIGTKEYAEAMQQVQATMLTTIAMSGDKDFNARLFSAGNSAQQVLVGNRQAERKVTTRTSSRGVSTSVTEGN